MTQNAESLAYRGQARAAAASIAVTEARIVDEPNRKHTGFGAAGSRIGRVVNVSGAQVIVLLDNPEVAGSETVPTAPPIGALVKMCTRSSTVFGMVSGMSIPIPAQSPGESEMKIVELELVGEALINGDGSQQMFQRGISFSPALGDAVLATDQEDLKQVYARPSQSSVCIGTIYQDQTLPAFVAVDELLGKHMAVLGTTGTGKSCAVAVMLRAILAQHTNGHVVLLDLHNEYGPAFADCAEVLGPGSLELPYWILNFEEISEIIVGPNKKNREADISILKAAILEAKQRYQSGSDMSGLVSADTPVPYRLSDVNRIIDEALGKLDKPTDSAPYLRLKEHLSRLQTDKRFAFMFPGLTVRDNMATILSRIFRIPVDGKPVTILDLSGVPSEILNVVISLLCRLTFDFALWSERGMPVLLVCEEAHRYVSNNSTEDFEPTRRALARIAKEGRKYGVSLCIVSQRPSDLSVEILSQCNTILAMRMGNQKDQEFVRGMLSEAAAGLIDSLPTLRTAEAIAVGEGVSVPVRLCFERLPPDRMPLSGTASFSTVWHSDEKDQAFVAEIVQRWRRQRR